jgi:hypothetical protein
LIIYSFGKEYNNLEYFEKELKISGVSLLKEDIIRKIFSFACIVNEENSCSNNSTIRVLLIIAELFTNGFREEIYSKIKTNIDKIDLLYIWNKTIEIFDSSDDLFTKQISAIIIARTHTTQELSDDRKKVIPYLKQLVYGNSSHKISNDVLYFGLVAFSSFFRNEANRQLIKDDYVNIFRTAVPLINHTHMGISRYSSLLLNNLAVFLDKKQRTDLVKNEKTFDIMKQYLDDSITFLNSNPHKFIERPYTFRNLCTVPYLIMKDNPEVFAAFGRSEIFSAYFALVHLFTPYLFNVSAVNTIIIPFFNKSHENDNSLPATYETMEFTKYEVVESMRRLVEVWDYVCVCVCVRC